jgi:tetratricopeptide (TPR) repeat protein
VATKLEEIKETIRELEGIKAKKSAYENAILAAQSAEKSNDLEAALNKYKEAKEIDASQNLPQTKITELEQKIDAQNALKSNQQAFDVQIKKGDDAFIAGNFEGAITLYKAAEQFVPNSPIVKTKIAEVKNKQADLAKQAAEEAYQNLLTSAHNSRTDGKLQEAITLYQKASKERPSDNLPKQKIIDIEQEIKNKQDAEANLAQRTLNYDKFMKAGNEQFKKEQWELALGNFTQASAMLPEKDEPNQKIEQIKNIVAKQKQENDAAEAKKEQFNNLVSLGDKAFGNAIFEQALQNYEEAYSQAPEITVQRKIDITKEKIKEEQKRTEDKVWQDKLRDADNAFTEKKYDEALELYNAVLNLKPGHERAKEQIDLINRLKTPPQEISQLQDLGTPT